MDSNKILKFKTDTRHRKQWFTGVSFSHPAKLSLPLQLWIIENYTKGAGDYPFTYEMLQEADKVMDWCDCSKT